MSQFILLILLFAAADRFSGGGLGWDTKFKHDVPGGFLRGRPLYYAFLALVVGCAAIFKDLHAAVWAIPFLIWRLPGWRILGSKGGFVPTTIKETVILAGRHALAPLAMLPFAYWSAIPLRAVIVPGVAFAVLSALLGLLNGKEAAKGHDVNETVELARGALFGVMVGMIAG